MPTTSTADMRTWTGSWSRSAPTSHEPDGPSSPVYARHSMPAPRTSDPSALFEAARGGDRVALARLLSLVERGGDPSRTVAGLAFKTPGDTYSVGITGAPGAG